jgi:hypothetical protein
MVASVGSARRVGWRVAIGAAAVVAAAAVGCKPGSKGGSGDGPAALGDAPAALGGGGCRIGEKANDDPPFCYHVPAGMTLKGEPVRKKGHFQITYEGEGGATISFFAKNLDAFDTTLKFLEANARGSKAADVKRAEIAGGNGKLMTYTTPGANGRAIVSVLVKGGRNLLECEASAEKKRTGESLLDACTQIHD